MANHGGVPTTASSWYDAVLLSDTPVYNPGAATVLNYFYQVDSLSSVPAGGDDATNSYSVSDQVTIPANAAAGSKYLLFVSDYPQ